MIERNIPIQLAESMAQPASMDCRLAKILPKGEDDPVIALTSLDRDVVYDDGGGMLVYKAKRGYTPFALDATADLSVDNSEMQALIAEFEMDGFTVDAIDRGVYDDARYVEYLVDYSDLSKGRALVSSGTIGRIRKVDNMVCFPELRSLTQQTKQLSIIELGSISCRATMGDERCKYPVATLWEDFEVTAVGLEADRVFTMDGAPPADHALRPGLVEWYTGDNAGRTFESEDNAGAVITLAIPTEKPIQVGDTGRRRPNCTNLLFGTEVEDGENSCFSFGNLLNYRGEWYRPVSESEQLMAPGAASSASSAAPGSPGQPPTSGISNPSFESGITGWFQRAAPTAVPASTWAVVDDPARAFDGTKLLRWTGNTQSGGGYAWRYMLSPNRMVVGPGNSTLQLSMRVRRGSGSVPSSARYGFGFIAYSAGHAELGIYVNEDGHPPADWHQASATTNLAAPAGTAYVRAALRLGGGAGTVIEWDFLENDGAEYAP